MEAQGARVRVSWQRIAWVGAAIVLLLLGVRFLGSRLVGRSREAIAEAGVATASVRRGTVEVAVTGTGTLEASKRMNVTSEVAGTVVAVHFNEGQVVRKGQVLVELRNDDLVAQVEQARLNLAAARNRLSGRPGFQDGKTFDVAEALTVRAPVAGRITWLGVKAGDRVSTGQPVAWVLSDGQKAEAVTARADGFVSELLVREEDPVTEGQVILRLENPTLSQEIRSDEIALEQAQQTLNEREQALAKLRIASPMDGIIVQRNVNVGDIVAAGDRGTALATILDTTSLKLTLQVDELDLPRLRVGQPVSVSLAAMPDRTVTGKIDQIAAEGTVQNGVATFGVTVTVPGHPDFRPGMTASGRIVVARKENVLTVPAEAVERRDGRAFVQVLEGGAIARRPVRTGLDSGTAVEVLEGLAEGERVVVARAAAPSVRQQGGFGPFRFGGGSFRPPGAAGEGHGPAEPGGRSQGGSAR